MTTLSRYMLILIGIGFLLTGCGGGGNGSDNEAEAGTDCIIGASSIGECKI